MDTADKRYLELLSNLFPTKAKASAEIINLNAILNLPKGTEYFASDIHGEYEAFSHILRNAAGSIRLKIDDVFGGFLTDAEKQTLATLVYYPREKMALILDGETDRDAWYRKAIIQLVELCRVSARKYTQSRVRKALPDDFAYIMEELLTVRSDDPNKVAYYNAIIDAVVETGRADALIEAFCHLIQRLAIDHLHIVGDIFDRGPAPHVIMELLMGYHNVDIQWGNHDMVWMGASLGQRGCIAHVVRNCARYGNLSILEDAYGINVLPLAAFAFNAYAEDPCVAFALKGSPELTEQEYELNRKIQKAMAVIQFKVEGQLIDENPSFGLEDRKLLDKIDYERGTVVVDGVEYELTDKVFPTIDPADPYRLTDEEEAVMHRLEQAFMDCEKLQRHMHFLLDAGSLYKISNSSLLLHACVPLNPDGSLMEVDVFGKKYAGRALYDVLEKYVRDAFDSPDPALRKRGRDLMWYLWLGQGSPLFAKSKMATFELYLIAEKEARKEVKNAFYTYINDEAVFDKIFEDFGMDPATSRIICGHVPVKVKDGEDPVKCGGKVLCIDGGFSRAYQATTGIAGYTLISNSWGFVLATHEPLESAQAAIESEIDIHSTKRLVEKPDRRTLIADTDKGVELQAQIDDLKRLLEAYEAGEVAERA
ncbi:fructose-bisphosphatase class III [Eggerthellaceae bacterium zg-887]|uniref:fructose-1,6-bisphosphatase n=1 Tax=Xiamenia xianingshaonis TaxID=2682776 RepID=UPI00140AE146|nr:fructose-1,6-bisphosphatase [Xiamenia xianingshaonis]NHM17045.1 fructose-bisphosphatase class III [Xiamenia xianingshaonis]